VIVQGFGEQTAAETMVMPGVISEIIGPVVACTSGLDNNRLNPAFDYPMLPDGYALVFREFSMVNKKQ
jgi:hypothetical protein